MPTDKLKPKKHYNKQEKKKIIAETTFKMIALTRANIVRLVSICATENVNPKMLTVFATVSDLIMLISYFLR